LFNATKVEVDREAGKDCTLSCLFHSEVSIGDGLPEVFKEIRPDDPVAHVLSLNLFRRHLTAAQRAMVGAKTIEMYAKRAKERQKQGGKNSGKVRNNEVPVKVPELQKGDARDQAGAAVGVSGKLIDKGVKILRNAVPEVVKAVEECRMSGGSFLFVNFQNIPVQIDRL
jgi:hypothetical protein